MMRLRKPRGVVVERKEEEKKEESSMDVVERNRGRVEQFERELKEFAEMWPASHSPQNRDALWIMQGERLWFKDEAKRPTSPIVPPDAFVFTLEKLEDELDRVYWRERVLRRRQVVMRLHLQRLLMENPRPQWVHRHLRAWLAWRPLPFPRRTPCSDTPALDHVWYVLPRMRERCGTVKALLRRHTIQSSNFAEADALWFNPSLPVASVHDLELTRPFHPSQTRTRTLEEVSDLVYRRFPGLMSLVDFDRGDRTRLLPPTKVITIINCQLPTAILRYAQRTTEYARTQFMQFTGVHTSKNGLLWHTLFEESFYWSHNNTLSEFRQVMKRIGEAHVPLTVSYLEMERATNHIFVYQQSPELLRAVQAFSGAHHAFFNQLVYFCRVLLDVRTHLHPDREPCDTLGLFARDLMARTLLYTGDALAYRNPQRARELYRLVRAKPHQTLKLMHQGMMAYYEKPEHRGGIRAYFGLPAFLSAFRAASRGFTTVSRAMRMWAMDHTFIRALLPNSIQGMSSLAAAVVTQTAIFQVGQVQDPSLIQGEMMRLLRRASQASWVTQGLISSITGIVVNTSLTSVLRTYAHALLNMVLNNGTWAAVGGMVVLAYRFSQVGFSGVINHTIALALGAVYMRCSAAVTLPVKAQSFLRRFGTRWNQLDLRIQMSLITLGTAVLMGAVAYFQQAIDFAVQSLPDHALHASDTLLASVVGTAAAPALASDALFQGLKIQDPVAQAGVAAAVTLSVDGNMALLLDHMHGPLEDMARFVRTHADKLMGINQIVEETFKKNFKKNAKDAIAEFTGALAGHAMRPAVVAYVAVKETGKAIGSLFWSTDPLSPERTPVPAVDGVKACTKIEANATPDDVSLLQNITSMRLTAPQRKFLRDILVSVKSITPQKIMQALMEVYLKAKQMTTQVGHNLYRGALEVLRILQNAGDGIRKAYDRALVASTNAIITALVTLWGITHFNIRRPVGRFLRFVWERTTGRELVEDPEDYSDIVPERRTVLGARDETQSIDERATTHRPDHLDHYAVSTPPRSMAFAYEVVEEATRNFSQLGVSYRTSLTNNERFKKDALATTHSGSADTILPTPPEKDVIEIQGKFTPLPTRDPLKILFQVSTFTQRLFRYQYDATIATRPPASKPKVDGVWRPRPELLVALHHHHGAH